MKEYASNLNGVAAYCYDNWMLLKEQRAILTEGLDEAIIEGQMKAYHSVLVLITGRRKLADIAEILRSMGLEIQS